MISCSMPASSRSYSILMRKGLLQDRSALASKVAPLGSLHVVITQDSLKSLYAEPLRYALAAEGLHVELFSFPEGESYKTQATKERLEELLFSHACGRDTCLIAVGGGVVTDLVGYLAATYCRGIAHVFVPTTLLAMIDASIGGKTGINTSFGKNLIGSIYPPRAVLVDPDTLRTLPKREVRNGIVEMIKLALACDADLFAYLEKHSQSLLNLDSAILDCAIERSCALKVDIVQQDENERGQRHLLNLGHTIGHALEHFSGYQLSHGEAVALGLLVEGTLSCLMGHLPASELLRVEQLLKAIGLPLVLPEMTQEQLLLALLLDKKTRSQRPRFVLVERIGSALLCQGEYCTSCEERLIFEAFCEVRDALCRC